MKHRIALMEIKNQIDTWCCCFCQLWWIFGKVSNWVYPIQKYPENRPQIQNRPLNREWNQPTNPRTALQIHATGSANSRLLLGKTQTILQFSIQNWANAGGSKVGKCGEEKNGTAIKEPLVIFVFHLGNYIGGPPSLFLGKHKLITTNTITY